MKKRRRKGRRITTYRNNLLSLSLAHSISQVPFEAKLPKHSPKRVGCLLNKSFSRRNAGGGRQRDSRLKERAQFLMPAGGCECTAVCKLSAKVTPAECFSARLSQRTSVRVPYCNNLAKKGCKGRMYQLSGRSILATIQSATPLLPSYPPADFPRKCAAP